VCECWSRWNLSVVDVIDIFRRESAPVVKILEQGEYHSVCFASMQQLEATFPFTLHTASCPGF